MKLFLFIFLISSLFIGCNTESEICFIVLEQETDNKTKEFIQNDSLSYCFSHDLISGLLQKYYGKIDSINGVYIGLKQAEDFPTQIRPELLLVYIVQNHKSKYLFLSVNKEIEVIDTFSFDVRRRVLEKIYGDVDGKIVIKFAIQSFELGIEKRYSQKVEYAQNGYFIDQGFELIRESRFQNKYSGRYNLDRDSIEVFFEILDSKQLNTYNYHFSLVAPSGCVTEIRGKDVLIETDTILINMEGVKLNLNKNAVSVNVKVQDMDCMDEYEFNAMLGKSR